MQCKASSTDKSPHQPLPYTITLASLVKGEVLSPEKIRATTGGIASPPSLRTTFLPPLVKGEVLSPKKFGRLPEGLLPIRTNPPKTSPSLKNRHHPCLLMNVPFVLHPHHPLLCTITLASLVKGRWIDGKAQTVALLRFACDTSTFLIYQTFCRQDGGIASQPSFACTNPSKTAPSFALHHHTCLPC